MPNSRGDGEGDAALGRAIELGDHDVGDLDRLGELLGLHQAILAGGRVDHQQHFLRRFWDMFLHDLA